MDYNSITFEWNQLKCHQQNGRMVGYQYRLYYSAIAYTHGYVGPMTTSLTTYDMSVIGFSVAAINVAGIGPHCSRLSIQGTLWGEEVF